MRIWGIMRKGHKIQKDAVVNCDIKLASEVDDWSDIIGELCTELDLSRPVLLKKHSEELLKFNRTVFVPSDFMESVKFDKFEIELLIEKRSGDREP